MQVLVFLNLFMSSACSMEQVEVKSEIQEDKTAFKEDQKAEISLISDQKNESILPSKIKESELVAKNETLIFDIVEQKEDDVDVGGKIEEHKEDSSVDSDKEENTLESVLALLNATNAEYLINEASQYLVPILNNVDEKKIFVNPEVIIKVAKKFANNYDIFQHILNFAIKRNIIIDKEIINDVIDRNIDNYSSLCSVLKFASEKRLQIKESSILKAVEHIKNSENDLRPLINIIIGSGVDIDKDLVSEAISDNMTKPSNLAALLNFVHRKKYDIDCSFIDEAIAMTMEDYPSLCSVLNFGVARKLEIDKTLLNKIFNKYLNQKEFALVHLLSVFANSEINIDIKDIYKSIRLNKDVMENLSTLLRFAAHKKYKIEDSLIKECLEKNAENYQITSLLLGFSITNEIEIDHDVYDKFVKKYINKNVDMRSVFIIADNTKIDLTSEIIEQAIAQNIDNYNTLCQIINYTLEKKINIDKKIYDELIQKHIKNIDLRPLFYVVDKANFSIDPIIINRCLEESIMKKEVLIDQGLFSNFEKIDYFNKNIFLPFNPLLTFILKKNIDVDPNLIFKGIEVNVNNVDQNNVFANLIAIDSLFDFVTKRGIALNKNALILIRNVFYKFKTVNTQKKGSLINLQVGTTIFNFSDEVARIENFLNDNLEAGNKLDKLGYKLLTKFSGLKSDTYRKISSLIEKIKEEMNGSPVEEKEKDNVKKSLLDLSKTMKIDDEESVNEVINSFVGLT